jgi:hypothetical protein
MALQPRRRSALDDDDPLAPEKPKSEQDKLATADEQADDLTGEQDSPPVTPEVPAARTPSVKPLTRTKKAKPAAGRRAHRVPEPQHRVEWNVHSRTVRSGLMAWAATRDRVQQRAEDVRELIRSAGAAVSEDDLVAIVLQVAENTGYPETEVAEAAGFEIES